MEKIVVRQIKSQIRRPKNQKDTLVALGLGRINKSREHNATAQVLGMVKTVQHLVEVKKK